MTINFDFSSADAALHILGMLQREEKVPRSLWKSLYATEGVKALLDNRIRRKDEIREYLLTGVKGSLAGAALLQGDLERLSGLVQKTAEHLGTVFHKWLPEALTFEQPVISFVLYGGKGEDSDPAVMDLLYALTLGDEEREGELLKKVLILLIRRYQNLEKYYLKNFLPIRRHMGFIYGLWDIQTAGLAALMEGHSPQEDKSPLELMDALLSEAAGAGRKDLERLGERFRKEVPAGEAGLLIYHRLYGGEEMSRIRDSLIKPTAPFILLREDGSSLFSREAEFFIDQLDSLLS